MFTKSSDCEPARYLDADRRHKSLYLKAADYEFLVNIRRRFTAMPAKVSSRRLQYYQSQRPQRARTIGQRPIGVFSAALRCEIRCHLRADVNEHIRRSPDVDLSGMSGCDRHPRTSMVMGVGSSLRKRF